MVFSYRFVWLIIFTPLSRSPPSHNHFFLLGLNIIHSYEDGPVVALLVGRSLDRSPVMSLGIFSVATDGTMCSGIDSASKNEYQENSWG